MHIGEKNIEELEKILEKHELAIDIRQKIINDYLLKLIPPGTKGVKRGQKFNEIIKNYLKSLNLSDLRFEIEFEKKLPFIETFERPDWYIFDKQENRFIIGMNQLDLWSGGHQLNRGSKYIINSKNN